MAPPNGAAADAAAAVGSATAVATKDPKTALIVGGSIVGLLIVCGFIYLLVTREPRGEVAALTANGIADAFGKVLSERDARVVPSSDTAIAALRQDLQSLRSELAAQAQRTDRILEILTTKPPK